MIEKLIAGINENFRGAVVESVVLAGNIMTVRTDRGEFDVRLSEDQDTMGYATWKRQAE